MNPMISFLTFVSGHVG